MKTGWKRCLAKLAEYLTYVRGRTVTAVVIAFRPRVAGHERFWAVLENELGPSRRGRPARASRRPAGAGRGRRGLRRGLAHRPVVRLIAAMCRS